MGRKMKNIALPSDIYSKVEKRLVGTGIDSVDKYVLFVIEELLKDDDADQLHLTEEDDEQVRKKLKDLGYLD